MANFKSKAIFAARHALRSPLRTASLAGLFLLNILAILFFLGAVESNNQRIDYLYLNTHVTGAIAPYGSISPLKHHEPLVRSGAMGRIKELGTTQDMYLEVINRGIGIMNLPVPLLAFSDFDAFVAHNEPRAMQHSVPGIAPFGGPMVVEFAPGYTAEILQTVTDGIPMIFHTELLSRLNVSVGDRIQAAQHFAPNIDIYIVGSIYGGHPISFGRFCNITQPLMLMHYNLHYRLESSMYGYAGIEFIIAPVYNRYLDDVHNDINEILRLGAASFDPEVSPALFLNDSELRFVVVAMEQNLSLLQQLWPVVVTLTCVLAAAISLLLMMQNAKLAAIMRALGTTKIHTQFILFAQQTMVGVFGIAIGTIVAAFVGISSELVAVTALFFGSACISSMVAIIIITMRPPLTLLQTKE